MQQSVFPLLCALLTGSSIHASSNWYRSLPWLLIVILALPVFLGCLPPLQVAHECKDMGGWREHRLVALAILLICAWRIGRGPIQSSKEGAALLLALFSASLSWALLAVLGIVVYLESLHRTLRCILSAQTSCQGWSERAIELSTFDRSFIPRVEDSISDMQFAGPLAVYGVSGLWLCFALLRSGFRNTGRGEPRVRGIEVAATVVAFVLGCAHSMLIVLWFLTVGFQDDHWWLAWGFPLTALIVAAWIVPPALGTQTTLRRTLTAVFLVAGVLATLFSEYAVFPWHLLDSVFALLGFVDIYTRPPRSLAMGHCFILLLTLGALLADERRRLSLPLNALAAVTWPLAAMAFASLDIDFRPPWWSWEPLEWKQYALPDPVIHGLVAAFLGSGFLLSLPRLEVARRSA